MNEGTSLGTGKGWKCDCDCVHLTGTWCSVCNTCAPGCSALFEQVLENKSKAFQIEKAVYESCSAQRDGLLNDVDKLRDLADARLLQIVTFRRALREVGERLKENGYGESGMYAIVKEALESEQLTS